MIDVIYLRFRRNFAVIVPRAVEERAVQGLCCVYCCCHVQILVDRWPHVTDDLIPPMSLVTYFFLPVVGNLTELWLVWSLYYMSNVRPLVAIV